MLCNHLLLSNYPDQHICGRSQILNRFTGLIEKVKGKEKMKEIRHIWATGLLFPGPASPPLDLVTPSIQLLPHVPPQFHPPPQLFLSSSPLHSPRRTAPRRRRLLAAEHHLA
uniref:Uncharacterized protein n=1 Tax=Setaria viridis TaxID=4556 RepID=A0A4U6W8H5_SETVI|nr:hypothetical protein SEVIR_1G097100v2 [Setaria viridis]